MPRPKQISSPKRYNAQLRAIESSVQPRMPLATPRRPLQAIQYRRLCQRYNSALTTSFGVSRQCPRKRDYPARRSTDTSCAISSRHAVASVRAGSPGWRQSNIMDAEPASSGHAFVSFRRTPHRANQSSQSLQSRATSFADLVDWLESVAFDDIDEDDCRRVVAFFGPLHRLGVSNALERQAP
jgi:hypothetical protein